MSNEAARSDSSRVPPPRADDEAPRGRDPAVNDNSARRLDVPKPSTAFPGTGSVDPAGFNENAVLERERLDDEPAVPVLPKVALE